LEGRRKKISKEKMNKEENNTKVIVPRQQINDIQKL
jgi:hypothetical protein